MSGFAGFPAGKKLFTPVPDLFFSELLPQIDSVPELKVTLHIIWLLHRKKGPARYASKEELLHDGVLLRGLKMPDRSPAALVEEGLERAVARGTLLHLTTRTESGNEQDWYFINSEEGRDTVDGVRRGELQVAPYTVLDEPQVEMQRPNVFVLYEQNIGMLQPMIAEELQEAEKDYPAGWIEEAFKIAAEQNVRKWRYVRAILERWATEGKDGGEAGRGPEDDRYRVIRGKYKDYIKY
jgi:DNA replication protein